MKKKILIVEDEFLIAINIKQGLEKYGFEVCGLAAEGEEAIQITKTNNPDAVLIDINLMGELDGIETAKIIAKLYPVQIIFTTGYQDPKLKERALHLEPAAYLLKPVNLNEIVDILSSVCN